MQRVFIGIPVDELAQQQIHELLIPVKKSNQDVRWVPELNLHLTLAFLGNRSIGVIDELIRSMDRPYQNENAFKTGLSTLERFPGSTGNIIALVFKLDEQLDHLYQVTQDFLTANGLITDHRMFRPHITLGRIKKASITNTKLGQQTDISLRVNKITFYQSTLSATGSIYLVLKETRLGACRV